MLYEISLSVFTQEGYPFFGSVLFCAIVVIPWLTKNDNHTFFIYEKKCLSYSSIQFQRVKCIYENSKISTFLFMKLYHKHFFHAMNLYDKHFSMLRICMTSILKIQ